MFASRRIGFGLVLAGLWLCITPAPASAQRQRADSIVLGCQHAAEDDVRIREIRVDTVRIAPERTIKLNDSTRVTTVSGSGEFYDGERNEWRTFTYDCAYDPALQRGRGRVVIAPPRKGGGR